MSHYLRFPQTSAALKAALDALLGDPGGLSRRRREGRAAACAEHTWEAKVLRPAPPRLPKPPPGHGGRMPRPNTEARCLSLTEVS